MEDSKFITLDNDETWGGLTDTLCPWCGEPQWLNDEHSDGVLTSGYEFSCHVCEMPIKVTDIDYDVTVYLEKIK